MTKAVLRFFKYTSVGVSTLLLDLLMLYVATSIFSVPYYLATPASFLVAVSINYFLSRQFIFKGTKRTVHHGYFYFIFIGIAGATLTTSMVVLLVQYLGLYYLLARVLVAGVVGIGNYLINLYFNFKVVGNHQ